MTIQPSTSDGLKITYLGFVLGHGGDAIQMLTLAHGVQALGQTVEIIVPSNEENQQFVERCTSIGVPARTSDQIEITGTGSHQRLGALMRLIRSIDCDVLHIHSGDTSLPRTMMLALVLRRHRPAVLATIHSPYPFFQPNSARARFWAVMARFTLRAVVSPSDHGRRFQITCGVPRRLAVTIRNAVDHTAFASGDPTLPCQTLRADEHTPVVLFSSRLDQQKRPLDAVRAFALAAADVPSAMLVFVGTGDQTAAIEDEARRLGIADRVHLVGYQQNVPDWLAATTVWVFPTERENFSVALLEAMASGRAIVATACPGNDEVVVNGVNSLTFAVGDVAAAADAIRRLLRDPRLRERLAEGARGTSAEYSVAGMVAGYRQLYERATGTTFQA